MKKEIIIVRDLVIVTIFGKYSSLRTSAITQVKLLAGQLGARLKECNDEEDSEEAKIFFESDNPEALAIMLNNVMWKKYPSKKYFYARVLLFEINLVTTIK